jgi:predicted deacylase
LPEALKVGDVAANPGETRWGSATSVELRDGTRVSLPVIVMNGREKGPRLAITAATHPTELVGVRAVQIALRARIDPSELSGSIIAFPVANPLGMQFGEYVSPHDLTNMSVAYPGSRDGTPTSRLANFIWENAAKHADLVMDFHENVKPCLHFSLVHHSTPDVENRALEAAKAFGITLIRGSKASFALPGTKAGDLTFSGVCLRNGIPAFTPEFEGSTEISFSENETSVRAAVRGLQNVLKKLGMLKGTVEPQSEVKVLNGDFEFWGMTKADRGGIVHRLVDVGTKLPIGTPIAKIVNVFGDELETIQMPVEGYLWGWTVGNPATNRNWSVQCGGTIAFVFRET